MALPTSALRGEDPQVEAELFAWAHRHKDEEEAAYAWEDSFEFGPVWKAPAEEVDPNELIHDRYLGMPREF